MTPDLRAHRLRQLFAAHAVLAAGWATWRLVESTPALASAWGGTFAASLPGRALALTTIVAGVLALGVVLARTPLLWRDPRAALLALALGAALPARAPGPDAFDLAYLGTVSVIFVHSAWGARRARRTGHEVA